MDFEDIDANGLLITKAEGDRAFTLSMSSSSSCAPTPTGIAFDEDDLAVTITLVKSGGLTCTADIAVTTYEMELPKSAQSVPDLSFFVEHDGERNPAAIFVQ
jgi:hypothetical protein